MKSAFGGTGAAGTKTLLLIKRFRVRLTALVKHKKLTSPENRGSVFMLDSRKKAIHHLAQSPLLRGVSDDVFQWLDPPPETIFLKAGDTLMRKGEANWDYFVLV